MQDTGLNILAITIFTITLSVFIGPIFHLSPAIPATVTFVLLGLVTVDTLGWQNQGVNLLLDFFASPEQKERIIYHEAGHFLTAYLLEIPIIGYSLTPWETLKHKNSGSGGVIFDTSILEQKKRDLQEFNLILERLGVVLMGGIAAEKFIYNNSQGGQEDLQKFREIYANVGLKDSNSQLTVSNLQLRQRQAILRSTNLIESNKKSYLALVEAMKERKSVAQCQDIIESNLESS
jgi:ATP-dependent Zn protease